jgi:hypothetical protein
MWRAWNLTVFSLTPSWRASRRLKVTSLDQQLQDLAFALVEEAQNTNIPIAAANISTVVTAAMA